MLFLKLHFLFTCCWYFEIQLALGLTFHISVWYLVLTDGLVLIGVKSAVVMRVHSVFHAL